ncbi:hypothetical protein YC2023_061833 [Brassica napus]
MVINGKEIDFEELKMQAYQASILKPQEAAILTKQLHLTSFLSFQFTNCLHFIIANKLFSMRGDAKPPCTPPENQSLRSSCTHQILSCSSILPHSLLRFSTVSLT